MKKVSRRKFIIDLFTLTTIALVADAVWLEKFFIETNEFFLGDADGNTTNLRVVQISDLHLRSIDMQHRMLAKKVNKLKPDLILFTGDSVDRARSMDLFDEYLSHFDQDLKKVAILGNREYQRGISLEKLRAIYLKHNTDLLVNDSKVYSVGNDKISITGIDDFLKGKPDFPRAISKYTPADHHIVLTHCPEHRDTILNEMGATPIDFVLSGHTHGGQVRILGFAPYKPEGSGRYLSGWYREESPHLYVSKGIGTTVLPIRFGSRAEMAIFHLKAKVTS